MNKKSKVQPKPLETINENPGNEESFIVEPESTQTMPQNYEQQSNPISKKQLPKEIEQHPHSAPQNQNNKAQEKKKKKKKTKSDQESQKPKINMSARILEQDLKLIQEQHDIATKKILEELKEQQASEDMIEIILKVINDAHKKTLNKITNNLRILPAIYSEEIVPVEISLTGHTRKHNNLTHENLKLASSRIKAQKPQAKNIKIFPKIPGGCDVVFKDGSVMEDSNYVEEKGENPQIERVKETVRGLEAHLISTEKNFLETIECHRSTKRDLLVDLNAARQSEKSQKKKSESRK